ncbi:biopolymer transporter ExbD [Marivita sp. GX14005]|uniref:ExbD/TolR family protein n=1 Tax=Marivita sp. GX14005 TaxID=2942276 RepID=UPI00201985EB|nr:biopolymer transporter ExbD [Marivita sp. GX14005]MCL3883373.1 biopolymer transporter ExbD [Marivita sp. GX14005]
MSRLARPAAAQTREPTIALINVVFLMLIFFMIAGTLAAPMERDLTLVRTETLEGRAPPDTLVIHADGRLSYRGSPVSSAAEFLAQQPRGGQGQPVRIVPDRALPARLLVRLSSELRAAGAERVLVVTERALP